MGFLYGVEVVSAPTAFLAYAGATHRPAVSLAPALRIPLELTVPIAACSELSPLALAPRLRRIASCLLSPRPGASLALASRLAFAHIASAYRRALFNHASALLWSRSESRFRLPAAVPSTVYGSSAHGSRMQPRAPERGVCRWAFRDRTGAPRAVPATKIKSETGAE
jgi:hypothetical protein